MAETQDASLDRLAPAPEATDGRPMAARQGPVDTELAAAHREIERLRAAETRLRQRTQTLADHLLEAERVNARLLPAEDEVGRLTTEEERLTAEQERLRAQADQFKAEAEQLGAEAGRYKAQAEQLVAQRARLEALLAEIDGARLAAEQHVAALRASTSWAATAPFRALKLWVRRLRR